MFSTTRSSFRLVSRRFFSSPSAMEFMKTPSPVGASPELYNVIAETYDVEVNNAQYSAPDQCTRAFWSHMRVPVTAERLSVADIGAGTGLAGQAISIGAEKLKDDRDLNTQLDAFDFSPAMLQKAKDKNVYNRLQLLDVKEPVDAQFRSNYDGGVCSGLFTHNHLKPSDLTNLLQFIRDDGILTFSTITSYDVKFNTMSEIKKLEQAGLLKLKAYYPNVASEGPESSSVWVVQKLSALAQMHG